jgi:hypothetical protein
MVLLVLYHGFYMRRAACDPARQALEGNLGTLLDLNAVELPAYTFFALGPREPAANNAMGQLFWQNPGDPDSMVDENRNTFRQVLVYLLAAALGTLRGSTSIYTRIFLPERLPNMAVSPAGLRALGSRRVAG